MMNVVVPSFNRFVLADYDSFSVVDRRTLGLQNSDDFEAFDVADSHNRLVGDFSRVIKDSVSFMRNPFLQLVVKDISLGGLNNRADLNNLGRNLWILHGDSGADMRDNLVDLLNNHGVHHGEGHIVFVQSGGRYISECQAWLEDNHFTMHVCGNKRLDAVLDRR